MLVVGVVEYTNCLFDQALRAYPLFTEPKLQSRTSVHKSNAKNITFFVFYSPK